MIPHPVLNAFSSMLVQLAVSMGLRVIASCGSEDKANLLRELGAAHVINRKTSDMFVELKKAGPIDIYIDHVGGVALEAAIENAAMHARFVICGAVSTYNGPMNEAYGVKVYKVFQPLQDLSQYSPLESVACQSIPNYVSIFTSLTKRPI